MTWGVNYVDGDFFAIRARSLIRDSGVLGKDSNSLFTFQVPRVHDSFTKIGMLAKRTSLSQHGIDQSGLTVVYVGNDSNVTNIVSRNFSHQASFGHSSPTSSLLGIGSNELVKV